MNIAAQIVSQACRRAPVRWQSPAAAGLLSDRPGVGRDLEQGRLRIEGRWPMS